MALADTLKMIRSVWKMGQEQFGNLFDVSGPVIGKYERGESVPSVFFVIKLEEYTHIPVKDLCYKELKLSDIPPAPITGQPPEKGKDDIEELKDVVKTLEDSIRKIQGKLGIDEEEEVT